MLYRLPKNCYIVLKHTYLELVQKVRVEASFVWQIPEYRFRVVREKQYLVETGSTQAIHESLGRTADLRASRNRTVVQRNVLYGPEHQVQLLGREQQSSHSHTISRMSHTSHCQSFFVIIWSNSDLIYASFCQSSYFWVWKPVAILRKEICTLRCCYLGTEN